MTTRPRTAQAWWRSPLAKPQRELGTDGDGLTDEQATQRLKRYGRNTFRKDRARPLLLVATSLAVVTVAALVPWTPLGSYFGFVPPPLAFYGVVAATVASYLVLVQWVKRRFYQLHPAA